MIKKIITAVFCGLILVGCIVKSETKKIDPATFEEISPRLYWSYKSNLQGKAISEGVSADGAFVYGRYIVQRTTEVGYGMSMQEWAQTYALTSIPFRASYADLEAKGAFVEPFAAKISKLDVVAKTITIDKGSKDGVRVGYYAYIRKNVDEKMAAAVSTKIKRYMIEDIGSVAALYEVVSVGTDTAVLETKGRSIFSKWIDSVHVQFGFPRKSKFMLLDNITDDVRDIAFTKECPEQEARGRIVDALVEFTDGDAAVVDELLKLLVSDEEDDRYVAAKALRGLTAEKFGYEYDDDPQRRAAAIERWKQWWAANRLAYSVKPPAFEENKRKHEEKKSRDDLYDW